MGGNLDEVGEVVRWLSRHLADPAEVPGDDSWLFDHKVVAFTTFVQTGEFTDLSITIDPGSVGLCVRARATLL
ncbi:DUF6879 family protein [Nocardia jiangsuensis]|uniref:DUF6879 family protein n=1 Tax=Nocardia jiangsuensis TaxID=1691563 RepID=A0ABV8E128_9NOCA